MRRKEVAQSIEDNAKKVAEKLKEKKKIRGELQKEKSIRMREERAKRREQV